MREKSGEIWVICACSLCGSVRRGGYPFEQKYQGMERLQCGQRIRVKGIKVVDDERQTQRLEEFTFLTVNIETGVVYPKTVTTYVNTPGSDSVNCQPLVSSSTDIFRE